jgi:hypothetical protein
VEAEAGRYPIPMIRIAIIAEAFEAIARTLAPGTMASEPQPNENGERVSGAQARPLAGHHQAGRAVGRTLDTQATLSRYGDVILRTYPAANFLKH